MPARTPTDDGQRQGVPCRRPRSFGGPGAWVQLSKTAEAIADCTSALEQDPDFLTVLLRRADLYLKVEKYQEAVNDLEKAHQLDGGNRGAWARRDGPLRRGPRGRGRSAVKSTGGGRER